MSHPNQPPNQLPPQGPEPHYEHWAMGPPPPPPPKPSKAKRVLLGVGIAFGSWLIGFLMGSAGGTDTTTTATPASTVTETVEAGSKPSTPPAPKKTTPPKPAATMDEGTYEIGVDAPAGRYKTVAEDSCYWKRSKDDSGTLDSILANDNVNDGARASVTVKKGEFFTSEGCGTWTKT